ncbi:TPA: hypothetical protein QEM72_002701 [Pseudomonas putida]|uniref:hypothetical protein n=1 Tax=Pseudomonas putida TaxID=303 RepID=UPI00236367FD|nr:hypothetical protein [Pseudomonas putida]MDD2076437.1 hypothetical protein [Pseudomonas putida]HDS1692197.1 hypothetical protein [Pseudomonas putida]
MSALAFSIEEEAIFVAVDTLSTDENGGIPIEVSKSLYQPHLGILFGVTGALYMLDRLPSAIIRHGISRGDEFTVHASQILQELWREYVEGFAESGLTTDLNRISTSVFQFGFSSATGQPECFQYSSQDNFEPRPLSGSAHKPLCPAPVGVDGPNYFIALMDAQRQQEQGKPQSERTYIGGQIIMNVLQPGSCGAVKIHEFES